MTDEKIVEEWVAYTVRLLVDHPEEVSIMRMIRPQGVGLRIIAPPSDVGKLIGQGGRTARHLRSLGGSIAAAHRTSLHLDIGNTADQ